MERGGTRAGVLDAARAADDARVGGVIGAVEDERAVIRESVHAKHAVVPPTPIWSVPPEFRLIVP